MPPEDPGIEALRARCRALEEQLRGAGDSSQEFLRQVIDINPHFVFAKDREGRFTLVNRAVAEAYGTTVEELTGKTDADFNPNQQEVAHFRADDLEVMDSLREKLIPEEVITYADGRRRWLQTIKRPILGPDGKANHVLGVATDITQYKELTEQLTHDALHDSLTGLPNRLLLQDRLAMAFERTRRAPEEQFAVLFLDLDRFKVVNDGLGHRTGDRVLQLVAERLQCCLRPGDTVARLGGDEFTLLLTDIGGPMDAVRSAECVHGALADPLNLGGRDLYVSASIGIAMSSPRYHTPEEILRDADTAMYKAKATSRGSHVVFDPEMHALAMAELDLETELRQGIERRELYLLYQPIVRLADGCVVELEALLRWGHPTRGTLEPECFLPMAAETGLLLRIEEWVLHEACRQTAEWCARPGLPPVGVTLNLSVPQFLLGDPTPRIRETLARTGLAPARLRIEITETTLLERFEPVVTILRQLRELGVRVDVDDFGTGYSSLSYLHRLPVDRLKIDRSFVAGLGTGGEAVAIAQAIVAVAHALGLEAMAEGVETAEQLDWVRRLRCSHAQGYLLGPPMAAQEVARLPPYLSVG